MPYTVDAGFAQATVGVAFSTMLVDIVTGLKSVASAGAKIAVSVCDVPTLSTVPAGGE